MGVMISLAAIFWTLPHCIQPEKLLPKSELFSGELSVAGTASCAWSGLELYMGGVNGAGAIVHSESHGEKHFQRLSKSC